MLGANNALGSVTGLKVVWSAAGYDDLRRKEQYSVWRPTHFEAELGQLAAEVRKVKARHVIWSTVPHVTIAPIARGLGGKVAPGSRYFPYYTPPGIDERRFAAHRDPNITAAQARAVDSAIDQYNDAIVGVVRAARNDGRDWYVLEVAGLLDRLHARPQLRGPPPPPAPPAETGTCSRWPACSTGSRRVDTWTTRWPGRRGGRRTSCRRRCACCHPCPTRGSCSADRVDGSAAGCSRSTGSTRPRSPTASSRRR